MSGAVRLADLGEQRLEARDLLTAKGVMLFNNVAHQSCQRLSAPVEDACFPMRRGFGGFEGTQNFLNRSPGRLTCGFELLVAATTVVNAQPLKNADRGRDLEHHLFHGLRCVYWHVACSFWV